MPPLKGSLRESALILLLMRLENIEHAKFRAQAQIHLDPEKGVEVFEEYMKVAFPYLESAKKQEKADHIKALEAWTKQGPMVVTPMLSPKLQSRMKHRIIDRDVKPNPERADRLYKKMGSTI